MPDAKLSVRQQAIRRAAEILGEPRKLARRLHVPMDALFRWMNGAEQPSNIAFLACVDIILENEDSLDGELLQDAVAARDAKREMPDA